MVCGYGNLLKGGKITSWASILETGTSIGGGGDMCVRVGGGGGGGRSKCALF